MATAKKKGRGKGKISKVMHEFKEGDLKSSSGGKVTSRKQAVAIALSEARSAGARIPKKKGAADSKPATKKSASKKTAAKKTAAKKSSRS